MIATAIKPHPILMPTKLVHSLFLQRGSGGSLDCLWGVQTHSWSPVVLSPVRRDLARMNGTPTPNQKLLWPASVAMVHSLWISLLLIDNVYSPTTLLQSQGWLSCKSIPPPWSLSFSHLGVPKLGNIAPLDVGYTLYDCVIKEWLGVN